MSVCPVVSSSCTAASNLAMVYGPAMSLAQLIGERLRHWADHADTMCGSPSRRAWR